MTTSRVGGPSINYIPGFDGLRGIAVIAVICHHFDVPGFGGGFVGVDVFFVLSGFLITRILQSRFDKEHRVAYADFYKRRARRILPAFWAMIAILAVIVAIDHSYISPEQFYHSAAIALVFLTQWQIMIDDLPGPLIHLWSLGWEENFYLLWPLVFAFVARRGSWRALRIAAVTAITALTLVRFAKHWLAIEPPMWLWALGNFRVDTIILGCAMALFTTPSAASTARRWGSELLAFAALVVLGATIAVESRDFFWAGGFTIVSAATFVIANHLRQRGPSALASLLELAPIRWTGLISYGLYLWHYPVHWWMEERGLSKTMTIVFSFLVTYAIATLSYYTLEAWFRRTPHRRPASVPASEVRLV